jgi:hypothetical protein
MGKDCEATRLGQALHTAICRIAGPRDYVYGVVDSARDKELAFAGARRYQWELRWLFEEGTAQHMAGVAPYMVPVAFARDYPYRESAYLNLWARRLGSHAGVLCIIPAGPDTAWNHFRMVFDVIDGEDRYYFRFYDPRVLDSFLPLCKNQEVSDFFGPITAIISESDSPAKIKIYRPAGDAVETEEVDLMNRLAAPARAGSAS